VLDIGTGTGILALMLAQKSDALLDALDIDEGAFLQARENVMLSPWFDRIRILNCSFQQFANETTERYDLIVTNPPYFHEASKPPVEARFQARHTDLLPFADLISGVKKILLTEGRFCIILPLKEGMEFLDLAQGQGLFCHHILRVKTRADKPAKRILMEFDRHLGLVRDEEMVLREEDENYSREYAELTSEYYIRLK
jgi:tRNA1Val (adenine37-N6)-methyltransferase